MLVLEDDAYYWLYYPSKGAAAEDAGADTLAQAAPPSPSSAGGGLSGLPPSMLSMDTEGRVLRIDTFSKVLVGVALALWKCRHWRLHATSQLTLKGRQVLGR